MLVSRAKFSNRSLSWTSCWTTLLFFCYTQFNPTQSVVGYSIQYIQHCRSCNSIQYTE